MNDCIGEWHPMTMKPGATAYYLVTVDGEFCRYTFPMRYVDDGDGCWHSPKSRQPWQGGRLLAWTDLPAPYQGAPFPDEPDKEGPVQLDIQDVVHDVTGGL